MDTVYLLYSLKPDAPFEAAVLEGVYATEEAALLQVDRTLGRISISPTSRWLYDFGTTLIEKREVLR